MLRWFKMMCIKYASCRFHLRKRKGDRFVMKRGDGSDTVEARRQAFNKMRPKWQEMQIRIVAQGENNPGGQVQSRGEERPVGWKDSNLRSGGQFKEADTGQYVQKPCRITLTDRWGPGERPEWQTRQGWKGSHPGPSEPLQWKVMERFGAGRKWYNLFF